MNKQEIFDTVVIHLRTQGARAMLAVNGKDTCAYRGGKGTKCAVGCLIPDELYHPIIENASYLGMREPLDGKDEAFRAVVARIVNFLNPKDDDDIHAILTRLQSIHDDASSWAAEGGLSVYGQNRLLTLAMAHQLDPKVLNG